MLEKCFCNQTHGQFNSETFCWVFCAVMCRWGVFSSLCFFGLMVSLTAFFFFFFSINLSAIQADALLCSTSALLVSWPWNTDMLQSRIMFWFQETQIFLRQNIEGSWAVVWLSPLQVSDGKYLTTPLCCLSSLLLTVFPRVILSF